MKARALPLVLLFSAACTGTIGEKETPEPSGNPSGSTGGGTTTAGAGTTTGGTTTGGVTTGGTGTSCKANAVSPGPSPLQRLTRFQYDNTVRDLLGDTTYPASQFPLEEQSLGFDNDANVLQVPLLLAEAYVTAAQDVANRATQNLAALVGCNPAATATATAEEQQCARAFVQKFGGRAYRHVLSTDEESRLFGVYQKARADFDFGSSIGAVIETALLSPQFLYRPETGAPDPVHPEVIAVGPWGIASRLSYFLWGTMPDDALFEAARTGELATQAGIQTQAQRMWNDPRAHDVVKHFHQYWLDLGGVDNQRKDVALFPDYTPEIGPLLRRQTESFVDHVFFDGQGTLSTLLTAPFTYLNGKLARYYGIVGGPTGDTFEKVQFPAGHHAGLLTEGSFLTWNATIDHTHPIFRGKFVRTNLLCDPPSAPPANIVDGRGTIVDPNATERERLVAHRTNASCYACHQMMDPIGLGLETFDASGRWRSMEGGKPVDASGEIVGTDVAGTFNGPQQLASKLAASQDVQHCTVLAWFRFASGRGETENDLCTVEHLSDQFAESKGDLKNLVLALTQTDSFRYRLPTEVSP